MMREPLVTLSSDTPTLPAEWVRKYSEVSSDVSTSLSHSVPALPPVLKPVPILPL